MSYISKTSTIITLFSVLSAAKLQSYTYDYGYNPNTKQYTRKIDIKQGSLQGIVVYLGANTGLPPVEQYLGIPYATPPVGNMRFMPTGSAPSWQGIKYADSFGHVCPQKLPNSTNMEKARKIYFESLRKYLLNESEDCLYLNIYAPFQETWLTPVDGDMLISIQGYNLIRSDRDDSRRGGVCIYIKKKGKIQKYPVMVFIHGESFEWNSGNPYDGSVLAAYGQVIVVTLNFRLGILGFLKAGIANDSPANFGLIDQIAALVWIKENIAKFGGDETKVTLFGHGTGAACVGHLMSSPMIEKGNTPLFQRAILMGGSSLSDWALATKPLEVTLQVANSLNCPHNQEEFTTCLRKKRLQDIMDASVAMSPYSTKFGPVVDNLIIPNEPIRLLTKYNGVVKNLELMYGVTEIESAHHLGAVALTLGMLEKERNSELRDYLKMRCEFDPDSCLARTLENYGKYYRSYEEPIIMLYKNHESDTPAEIARDMLLDVLSDASYTAPIIMLAKLHSALNPQSYFYVFGHTTSSKDYVLNKSVHGEELPYVFGVPLDGPKFHFEDHYSSKEKLLAELVMSLWCNFAYSGNPSVPGMRLSQAPYFDVSWPEFDEKNQRYLYLSKNPEVRQYYRHDEMKYWNEFFPLLSNNRSLSGRPKSKVQYERPIKVFKPPNYPEKQNIYVQPDYSIFPIPPRATTRPNFGTRVLIPNYPRPEDETPEDEKFKTVLPQKPKPEQSNTLNILVSIGAIFLLANVIIFAGLYFKFVKMRKRNSPMKSYDETVDIPEEVSEKQPKIDDQSQGSGCNLITRLIGTKSSKSEDTYEAVKTNESCSSKRKLTRQVSSSTIDAHTKVRDWIAQEIVHRYSPKFLRRARHQNSTESKKHKEGNPDVKETKPLQIRTSSKMTGSTSTLGQSPTRPVSPVEDFKDPVKPSLIPVQKQHKKAEKVSVAVDATPAGRGSSVLMQEPIELTKSLDYGSFDSENDAPLRRSVTLEDFSAINNFKNSANINLKFQPITEPTIIKIEHSHSKSDPADISSSSAKKLKTFEPQDINVTSRDEVEDTKPLTPEESLQTIKRRNFPKVLPDLPGDSKQSLANKRRSMPAPSHLFLPIPENSSVSQPNSPTGKGYLKHPPVPPPRISSSLGKNSSTPNIQSPVLIAQEPPLPEEPEVACNNLFIGPLIPSRENRKVILKPADSYKYNNQPIYDNLNPKVLSKPDNVGPKTVVTSDPYSPVKRMEPKVIIKPKITRTISDPAKNKGPRVVVNDHMMNQVEFKGEQKTEVDDMRGNTVEVDHLAVPKLHRQNSKQKSSQIPTIVKGSNTSVNKESSSDSTPSESSDTGTVVKRV